MMTLYEAAVFWLGALLIFELTLLILLEGLLVDEIYGKKDNRAPYSPCEDCQTSCKTGAGERKPYLSRLSMPQNEALVLKQGESVTEGN